MEEPDPYGPLCWRRSSCRPTVEFSHHVIGRGRAPIVLGLDREEVLRSCPDETQVEDAWGSIAIRAAGPPTGSP